MSKKFLQSAVRHKDDCPYQTILRSYDTNVFATKVCPWCKGGLTPLTPAEPDEIPRG